MNKTEFIEKIAKDTELTKKDVAAVVDSYHNTVTEALKKKDKIQFVGFGTFETSERPERKGRNPQTGEEIVIKACTMPKFKPGKALKDALK